MQQDESGDLKPVYYFSKKLNEAQRNYTVRDKETLALVLARPPSRRQKFLVRRKSATKITASRSPPNISRKNYG